MAKSYEDQIKRLKEIIAIELDHCNREDFPYVCHMASDPESRKEIEEMVIQLCSKPKCTVQQALDRIERSYNPNRMED